MAKTNKTYSIALLIETSSTYGRQILHGIRRFIQTDQAQNWIAAVEERDLNTGVPGWLDNWSGDGVISRLTTTKLENELTQRKIAVVDLTDRYTKGAFVTIRSDDEAIGRLGAEHFLERSLPNFAFCGYAAEGWSQRRKSGFLKRLENQTKESVFTFDSKGFRQTAKRWQDVKAELTKWLVKLPKPIGIMASNDVRGKQLIDCCYQANLEVPETVAILGVDNDDLLCDFCHPPMTSVIPNAEEVGFQSAMALSKMLKSKQSRKRAFEVIVPPLGIVTRRSTDMLAVEDEDIESALKFIRDNACQGVSVAEVIDAVGISRSSIERKFRAVVGRSPQQEIRRVQLQKARNLLCSTDFSIEFVAASCGYEHPEYLHVVFKREFGMTPGQFRERPENRRVS